MNELSVPAVGARRRPGPAVGLTACAVAFFLAGGCAGPKVVELTDPREVAAEIQDGSTPLMLDFYKAGCAACMVLEGTFGQLAEEYDGRVRFVRHQLLNLMFLASSPEMQQKYDIVLYPTVILFVNGVERKRWVAEYDPKLYYEALTEAAGPPNNKTPPDKAAQGEAKAGQVASKS